MATEGLEFLFELNAKLDGATKMVRELSKLEKAALSTDKAIGQTEKQTGLFGKTLGKVGGAVKGFATASLAHFAALASFEGLKAVAGAVYNIGREALMAAGEAERLRRSFTLLAGEEGNSVLAFLDALANSTEFTDGALKGFGGELLRAGFKGEKFERAMAAVVDIAAQAPDKMQGAAEALSLLSRVQLGGGLSGRQLRTIGVEESSFFGRLAKDLGIGIKEVEKRVNDGRIKANVVLEALYSEITAKTKLPLGGAGVTMSTTFLAQLEKTKDIIPNLFEELEGSGALEGVTDAMKNLVTAFDPGSPTGKKIIDGLDAMLHRFGQLVSDIDFEKWGNRVIRVMEFIEGLVVVGGVLVEGLFRAFEALGQVGEAIGELVFDVEEAYNGLTKWWTEIVFGMDRAIKDFFNAAANLGDAIWQGIKAGITRGVDAVKGAITGLATGAMDTVKDVLGIKSPSTVFAGFGLQVGAGFEMGFLDSVPAIEDAVSTALDPSRLLPAIPEIPSVPTLPELVGFGPQDIPGLPSLQVEAPAIPGLALGGGGAGNTMNVDITVNVQAGPGGESGAREAGEQIAAGIRAAMADVFDLWGAEAGA